MVLSREVLYVDSIEKEGSFFLAGDIGGTNSNIGIFSLKSSPVLVLSLHYKSQKIEDFTSFMKDMDTYLYDRYGIRCTRGCIGVSGIVYPARVSVHPTNLSFWINVNEVMKVTSLKDLFLINDFEAVALGRELINPHDILVIQQGVYRLHANEGFIGAGTGLGKSLMVWAADNRRYFPVASEGGHADIPLYDPLERALGDYIYGTYGACPISWEGILSGAGIQRIYRFLGTYKNYPRTELTAEIEVHDFSPDKISLYAQQDERCNDTFKTYVKLYARCAKNFVLEGLTLNGLYIAGGIAAKNTGMFLSSLFIDEFLRCGKHSKTLASVPVFVIADYNVSLYGALVAGQLRKANLF
ncbi:glucokinase [Candidatus Dependentiae bacterium]|nr:glucokinase [Candidatus Dependentiae bacterium]